MAFPPSWRKYRCGSHRDVMHAIRLADWVSSQLQPTRGQQCCPRSETFIHNWPNPFHIMHARRPDTVPYPYCPAVYSYRITPSVTTWNYSPSLDPMAAYHSPHSSPSPRPTPSVPVFPFHVFFYPSPSWDSAGNDLLSGVQAVLSIGLANSMTDSSNSQRVVATS